MTIKKIFALIFLCSAFFSAVHSETYEEVEKKYLSAYNNLTARDRKALEAAHKQIMDLSDKNIRMIVMQGTYDSLPAYCKKSASASTSTATAPKATSSSPQARIANLKNENTRIAEVTNIISTYTFKGSGTKTDPLLISEPWELYALTASWNSKDDHFDSIKLGDGKKVYSANVEYIKLTKDLDFEDSLPITDFDKFSGVFDGDNFAIKNLKSTTLIFRKIEQGGIVKNLRIENTKFSPDKRIYSHPSPFCENLEGSLINCAFDGSLNFSESYDIAYSAEGSGYAIGCVSNNSSGTKALAENVKTFGCGTSSSNAAKLNDEISNWNALYYGLKNHSANSHIVSSNGKLTIAKGEPAKKAVPNRSAPGEARFSNILNAFFRYDNGGGRRTAIIENIAPFFHGTYYPTDSKFSITPSSQKANRYIFKVYEKQIDGSYKETVLDPKNATVVQIFNKNGGKYIHLRYAGYREILLYTKGSYIGANMKFSQAEYIENPTANDVAGFISSGLW